MLNNSRSGTIALARSSYEAPSARHLELYSHSYYSRDERGPYGLGWDLELEEHGKNVIVYVQPLLKLSHDPRTCREEIVRNECKGICLFEIRDELTFIVELQAGDCTFQRRAPCTATLNHGSGLTEVEA